MSGPAKTSEKLAKALAEAGLDDLAKRALTNEFHDYMSDHVFPEIELMRLLHLAESTGAGDPEKVRVLIDAHTDGEFDASAEEAQAWADSPEGQYTIGNLYKDKGG